ncbi:MAG: YtfJ family protein [Pseudomonadales bacterium]
MRLITLLLLSSLSLSQAIAAPSTGKALPSLSINKGGALSLEGDEVSHSPWSTDQLSGKPALIQYLAARPASKKMTSLLTVSLEQKNYQPQQLNVVAIVNGDDAIFGTGGFVSGQLESNKRKYPNSYMVLDKAGVGLGRWQLKPKSAAIILIDEQGIIQFVHEGETTADIVSTIITTLDALIAQNTSKTSEPSLAFKLTDSNRQALP